MKRILFLLLLISTTACLFAQSDDDLFGSDDDFFADDGIEEVSDVKAKSDLSKGVIFDSGTVKVGGSLTAGVSTNTILYAPDKENLGDNIHDTKFTPDLSALLSVDARPTETLRIYTKFGLAYPFESRAATKLKFTPVALNPAQPAFKIPMATSAETTILDWFKLKELFTDFSVFDTAFFRFGIHTVTWGAGYFFSPVSDIINSSSIDPENPEKQVDGSLNLRTQIVFPGTQNCLWFYMIPSTNFTNQTAESYARDTALAGKADIVLGGWEFGLGGYWKYQNAPKAMLTATGSLKKVSFFGEFVYSYGALKEWKENKDWNDKTNIFQATAGLSYYWKDEKFNIAAQYFFEGNEVDPAKKISQYGHNVALMVSKGDLFKNPDFSLSLFAMANFGHKEASVDDIKFMYPEVAASALSAGSNAPLETAAKQATDAIPSLTANLMLNYTPFTDMKFGLGPVMTFKNFETNPTLSLKLTATLGGGKF